MSKRLERIREEMSKQRVDAMLITNLVNIRYISGFTGSTATVIITNDEAIILVDSRYVLQASGECPDFDVILYSGGVLEAAAEILDESAPKRLGFEPNCVTYSTHLELRRVVSKNTRLIGVKGMVEKLRMVKDSGEIDAIKRAVVVADKCFSHVVSWVKPGMTEREIALEMDTYMRKLGAEKESFDTIVAAGPNAACPHHQPTGDVLKEGQMLKMDFGALVDGYCSDLTRTIFMGEPDERQREVYNVVLDAQMAAIHAIKPGVKGSEIDTIAREHIKSEGYGDYFGHGLGHSIGLTVHDGDGFSQRSSIVLEPGMVITVEPGIYVEDWGGVRIEDDIVVTESGVEVLTKSTKDIVVVR
ncbi:MAG: Xaa-Pro peptidase family protein [Armatimonadota bacterium]